MRALKLIAIAAFLALGFGASGYAQKSTAEPELKEIVKKMDELYRSNTSFSEVEMEIVTPHWQRTLEMEIWSQGTDKTFIRILLPRKEKGVGTLRIGNEMWNYLPKTNKVMKIPPSMMMGSWMGSDFTNDDLVKEITYLEDYTYQWASADSSEPNDDGILYIELKPKPGVPVVWGSFLMAVRRSDLLPVWEKYYDEKGRLMRVMRFSEIRQFGSRTLPSTMEMIPANKEGHRTFVRYRDAEFDIPIDDDTFSLRNLRSPK